MRRRRRRLQDQRLLLTRRTQSIAIPGVNKSLVIYRIMVLVMMQMVILDAAHIQADLPPLAESSYSYSLFHP